MINIIFFGGGNYPLPVLENLFNNKEIKISLIICPPDKLLGRKKILTENPVKKWAIKNKIHYVTPFSFSENDKKKIIEIIKKNKVDIGLVGYFGLKIPEEIYSLPNFGTINIHFSLLPKYRGPAPIQHAIINGDKEIGITILKIAEKFDSGEIIYQEKYPLKNTDNVDLLYHKLFDKTAIFIFDIIKKYISKEIIPYKQNEEKITYAGKITNEKGKIDWSKKQVEIERLIRAVNPNPGAWTEIEINKQTKRLKILKSHISNEKLVIDEVQLEGKKPVSFSQFQTSYKNLNFN